MLAGWDRRPLAFVAAALVLALGVAAAPIVLRGAFPAYGERLDAADEVGGFAVIAGLPALAVGAMALLAARVRGNAPPPASAVITFSLPLILSVCWMLFMSMAWGLSPLTNGRRAGHPVCGRALTG